MTLQRAMPFGERLRLYRDRAGLTQEELAERADLTASAVSALERGARRRPYPNTLRLLSSALGLTAEEYAELAAAVPRRDGVAERTDPAASAYPPSNLPVLRTKLIGRDSDIAGLTELLGEGETRLITLTGVGGCGKTSLALHAADEVRDASADGVWVVELSSVADPALVAQVVAAVLGVQETPGVPLLDTLVGALRTRTALLVLDNCEHLIDACAQLTDRLLTTCPNVRILATSREALQVPGERQWRVLPLTAPDPDGPISLDDVAHYSSVQLFVERAHAAADFRLTEANAATAARICARLAGIPLALELAAARTRVLAVEQIVERLDDTLRLLTGGSRAAPTRQQTLRAAMDWSYDLLTGPEQAPFAG
jgi:transcriptional regulator with XRE-family HTH domain